MSPQASGQPHVVIIGAGFAGLECARRLKKADVRITLFDTRNHHLFQPLLYQVATCALAAPDIAAPIRQLFKNQTNVTVFHRRVLDIDAHQKKVFFDGGDVHYDYLVVAAGAVNQYYGNPQWEQWAPGLKTVDDAFTIRNRVLGAFEEAELESDPIRRKKLLTFAVVGGGATGVELAGALSEIARRTMLKQFRNFNPSEARVLLIEGGPRLLNGFPQELCDKAKAHLEDLQVEVMLDTKVENIDGAGVHTAKGLVEAKTVIWGAGVGAEPIGKRVGATTDRAGRIIIDDRLNPVFAPENPISEDARQSIWVCGDIASLTLNGKPVPGVAPAAIQMGNFTGKRLLALLKARTTSQPAAPSEAFKYRDKGQLATIGKARAVAAVGKWRQSGFIAWMLWVFVHVLYLASFRNRIVVMFEWAWAWFSWSRPSRIILQKNPRWPPPEETPLLQKPTLEGAPLKASPDAMATEALPSSPLQTKPAAPSLEAPIQPLADSPAPTPEVAPQPEPSFDDISLKHELEALAELEQKRDDFFSPPKPS